MQSVSALQQKDSGLHVRTASSSRHAEWSVCCTVFLQARKNCVESRACIVASARLLWRPFRSEAAVLKFGASISPSTSLFRSPFRSEATVLKFGAFSMRNNVDDCAFRLPADISKTGGRGACIVPVEATCHNAVQAITDIPRKELGRNLARARDFRVTLVFERRVGGEKFTITDTATLLGTGATRVGFGLCNADVVVKRMPRWNSTGTEQKEWKQAFKEQMLFEGHSKLRP